MNKWLKRLSNWFLQIENEVMVPFVLVGILVIGSFSMISYYNGYTMQKNSELELADTLFEDVNRDLHFLEKRLPEEEIAEKYRNFERGRIRILDRDGEEITAGTRWENTSVLAVSEGGNPFGWRLEYRMNERIFGERILEQQSYLVVGAIASLILICQASIFISHSITRPIRAAGGYL